MVPHVLETRGCDKCDQRVTKLRRGVLCLCLKAVALAFQTVWSEQALRP
jgi:hypothetical protein